MSTNDSGGMRERKKLATRDALSAAALRLALEHGPQNVRVDDIAEAAGVSPRTYNNYFSSREQAIVVGLAAERGHALAAALRARPLDEPLEHAVVGALIEQYSDEGEPDRDTLALITSAPALQTEFLDTIAAIERPLAEAIAARAGPTARAGSGPKCSPPPYPAAARVAAQRWLQPQPDTRFSVMLRDAPPGSPPPCGRGRPMTHAAPARSAIVQVCATHRARRAICLRHQLGLNRIPRFGHPQGGRNCRARCGRCRVRDELRPSCGCPKRRDAIQAQSRLHRPTARRDPVRASTPGPWQDAPGPRGSAVGCAQGRGRSR